MTSFNAYEDEKRAEAYARLEYPGTYFLAYRDIPKILTDFIKGNKALDFGCGTGRSTRFLQKLNFDVIGIDISKEMLNKAREFDPDGDYRFINDGDFSTFDKTNDKFDLVLSAFTFDNIPTMEHKVNLFCKIGDLLVPNGKIVSIVSSPKIYLHEWESFSTKDYPENKNAKSGDIVKIINTSIDDNRPVEDIVWTHKSYLEVYKQAGLEVVAKYEPLAKDSEPYEWVNETKINPWVIYVLKAIK